jgi:hypothetical protein
MKIKLIIPNKVFYLILFYCLFQESLVAQNQKSEFAEISNHPKIKTILFYRTGWDMSMPVYYLGEDESLDFRFDYLDRPEIEFGYYIRCCTHDWQINDIPEHYYMEGFNDLPLDKKEPSRNTTQYFTHYSLTIPNEDIKLLRSGNYILFIYDRNNPENVIITRRFCVAENKTEISGLIKMPNDHEQELNLKVDISQLGSRNPLSEVKFVVCKNYSWRNIVPIKIAPVLRGNFLYLDLPFQVIAEGGNEFRFFDTKNTKYDSERIDKIEYCPPYFCFTLKADEIKGFSPYFTSTDLNGRFFIDIPDADDRNLDADYVNVDFSLKATQPFNSDIYIYGSLTNWNRDESCRMIYNSPKQVYEKRLLLKQGYYNYAYAEFNNSSGSLSLNFTEGNHAETENDYLIFVYYSDITSDMDRLVGFTVINSKGKRSDLNSTP